MPRNAIARYSMTRPDRLSVRFFPASTEPEALNPHDRRVLLSGQATTEEAVANYRRKVEARLA